MIDRKSDLQNAVIILEDYEAEVMQKMADEEERCFCDSIPEGCPCEHCDRWAELDKMAADIQDAVSLIERVIEEMPA